MVVVAVAATAIKDFGPDLYIIYPENSPNGGFFL